MADISCDCNTAVLLAPESISHDARNNRPSPYVGSDLEVYSAITRRRTEGGGGGGEGSKITCSNVEKETAAFRLRTGAPVRDRELIIRKKN